MERSDLLVITADHGCDPTTAGTDHSREYVPLLLSSPRLRSAKDLGIRRTFADVGATVADNFQLTLPAGQSFLGELESLSLSEERERLH
jgi:phosphopentomutase